VLKKPLYTFLGLFLSTQSALAIVNAEDLKPGPPKEGLSTIVDISAAGASGNSDYSQISSGLRVQFVKGKNTSFIVSNYTYGESNGDKNTDKAFIHGRHIRKFSESTSGEAFAQTQYNDFTRLSSRNLIGGGARLALLKGTDLNFDLGLGIFYEREELSASATDPGTIEEHWRLNTYLVVKYAINNNLRLASTTYYQPVANRVDDYRILEDFSMLTKAGDSLEFKISINIAHDNQPPAGVKMRDISYIAGFIYRLED
jgi:hypothetical protein